MVIRNLKYLFIFQFLLISFGISYSIDIKTKIEPQVLIPKGDSTEELFTIGGGISGNLSIQILDNILLGTEISTFFTPLNNTGTYGQFIAAGLAGSLFFYPFSIISIEAGGSGGVYSLTYNEESISNLWWKVHGSLGIRISPTLSLSAYGGYINYLGNSQTIYSGIFAGLSAVLSLDTEKSTRSIDLDLDQLTPVFPLFYSLYKNNSIGTLTIQNNETAEIRNLKVSFRAENYTGSDILCGDVRYIKKKGVIELPLYANFTDSIQNFTEDGKISGEVVFTYSILGTSRTVVKSIVIDVYNRNSFSWSDTASLVSFISPTSPEVLDYSKFAVGVARSNLKTGLNRNMQFAMYLFEGLRLGGISYSNDRGTPYKSYHNNPELIDYIQYPFQTLSYSLGDYDDIGLLLAASLESVGIKSAIISTKDDFIVAYSLNITPEEAENLFNGTENLLTINNEVWMPLTVSNIREGFINSWNTAMKNLNSAFNNNENVEFVIVQEAWKTYSPSGIKGRDVTFDKPLDSLIVRDVEKNLLRYISSEFTPKIALLKSQMNSEGNTSKLNNKLGQLYIRAGLYDLAKAEFYKAIDKGSFAALVNLGNIYMIEREFDRAKQWFQKALNIRPDNEVVLRAMNTVNAELDL